MGHWITVEQVGNTRQKEGGGGYTDFSATTETGERVFCNVGWKNQQNMPVPGLRMEFEPYSGQLSFDPGNYQGGKRVAKAFGGSGAPPRDMSPAGNPYNGAPRPQAAAAPAARVVPTYTQAKARLLQICGDLGVTPDSGHVTTLFLGLLRGDIKRDPTPEEVAAEAAQREAAAKAAQEAAERAAAQAALASMPPAAPVSDNIPF